VIILVENIALPSVEDGKKLEEAARAALNYEKVINDVDLSIVIEDDAVLKELNKQYRGIDSTTDVLSFSANEIDPSTGVTYLGDIIISLEQAQRQAEKSGHALLAELQLLAVHGTLHLLGHDHAEDEEKEAMWASQKQILTSLGVELAVWPEG
jgi:probable rRNA maturation factor